MLGLCLFPQGEVGLVVLLAHTFEFAAGVQNVVQIAARECAVAMIAVIGLDVKVHAAVALVGVSVRHDLLHQFLLLDDVSRGVRLDAGRQHVERLHRSMVAVGVVLCHFHGLQLLEACLLGDFVLALIGIVLQVAHIGDVAHVTHLVTQLLQVAEEHVKRDGRPRVSQVRVTIDRRAAHIHAHHRLV